MKIDELTEDQAKAVWDWLSSKIGCELRTYVSHSGPKMNIYEMKAYPGYPERYLRVWSFLYLSPVKNTVKTVCAGIRRDEAGTKTVYKELLKKLVSLARRGDVLRSVRKGLLEDAEDFVVLAKGTSFEQLFLEHYL